MTLAPCEHPIGTIARDHHRHRLRHHQRLVADIRRCVPFGIDLDRAAQVSAVAAAEHDRRLAGVAQQVDQCQYRRGLAGTADVIISNAQHGDAGI
jgi:hypothetical protein